MIEVLSAPDHVAAFRISGTVTPEDYNAIIPMLEKKLHAHPHIGVLADLTDLGELTAEAIRRDISYGMSKFGQLHRFRRAAVITDKRWIAVATQLTGTLFPQVETRVFAEDESGPAMAWVAAQNGGKHGRMLGLALAATAILTVVFLKSARKRR